LQKLFHCICKQGEMTKKLNILALKLRQKWKLYFFVVFMLYFCCIFYALCVLKDFFPTTKYTLCTYVHSLYLRTSIGIYNFVVVGFSIFKVGKNISCFQNAPGYLCRCNHRNLEY
jgi:hypothetical protein